MKYVPVVRGIAREILLFDDVEDGTRSGAGQTPDPTELRATPAVGALDLADALR
jgi:hypothetical protein